MAFNRNKLEERIALLRADIDALIDEHVKQVAEQCPGVPPAVLRGTIIGYNAGCQCSTFLNLAEKGTL